MTEKIGGVEGTKLDVDFVDMERVSICIMLKICTFILLDNVNNFL